jgi:ParB/RepB/Spo0J family partition protein
MKKREETFTTVPVGKIVSESNRKHGGIGNIVILAESIEAEGLINPPTVVANEDGTYRVIAGRRRVEAVRQLKWKEVQARIIDGADAARLEFIGLAENVNRQEKHPLDEAETFKKLLDKGTDIKDIAALYDRLISGIHHRVRLCNLQDELKEMFREGKINLSGAALLASLPAEDQAGFAKKYADKPVGNRDISDFIHQVQHCVIAWIADKQCEKCKKRTNNTDPGLFEDFYGLEDVCFDHDCYAGKWKKLIASLIAKEDSLRTENNIILGSYIPNFLPRKTETVTLGEAEYKILSPKKHRWEETSKKAKKDTAWLVTASYASTDVKVERVAYKVYERPDYSYYSAPSDPVKDFLIDQVSDVAIEEQKAVAEKVKEKYLSEYALKREIRNRLFKIIIDKRLREESRENLAALFLRNICEGDDTEGHTVDFGDKKDQEIFNAIFGPENIRNFDEIPREPLSEKLFLFLFTIGLRGNNLPDINDSEQEWENTERSAQWKFLQITRDEYVMMYWEILSEAIRAAIPGPAQVAVAKCPKATGKKPEEAAKRRTPNDDN